MKVKDQSGERGGNVITITLYLLEVRLLVSGKDLSGATIVGREIRVFLQSRRSGRFASETQRGLVFIYFSPLDLELLQSGNSIQLDVGGDTVSSAMVEVIV